MKLVLPLLLSSIYLVLASTATCGCWTGRDPIYYGRECPVIVTGTIVDIEHPQMLPARGEDTAVIAIHKVHKNIVGDEPLKAGGVVRAKMHSTLNRMRVSTDLRYKLGTRAIWMLQFGKDGCWHINLHPVQQQPVEKEDELAKNGAFGSNVAYSVRKVGGGTVTGPTRAELFDRWQNRANGDRKESAQKITESKEK